MNHCTNEMSDEDDPLLVLTRLLLNGLELEQSGSNHDISESREHEMNLNHNSVTNLILAPGLYKE